MNKKFLSAILFGALMVTSTGTFVSCKDYDDDIDRLQEQIDANKAGITELKTLIENGDYVTDVTKEGDNIKVTFKKAGSKTLELNSQKGSTVTVEDGILYIDGKAQTLKVAQSENLPSIKIDENGEWAALQEDGTYKSTGIPASGVTVSGSQGEGFTLTVYDKDGKPTEVKLPTAASAMTDLIVLTETHATPVEFEIAEYNFVYTGTGKPDRAKWAGPVALPADGYIMAGTSAIPVQINPTSIDGADIAFKLVDSKNNYPKDLTLVAKANTALITAKSANANGLYDLEMQDVYFKGDDTGKTAFMNQFQTSTSKDIYYAVTAGGSVRSKYEVTIATGTAVTLTKLAIVDGNDEAVEINSADDFAVNKASTGNASTPDGKINANEWYSVTASADAALYDMHLSWDKNAETLFGLELKEEAGSYQFRATKTPDNITKAGFELSIETVDKTGVYKKATVWLGETSVITNEVVYDAIPYQLKDETTDKNYFSINLDKMRTALGTTGEALWNTKADFTKSTVTYLDENGDAFASADGIDPAYVSKVEDGASKNVVTDATKAKFMKFLITNADAGAVFEVNKQYTAVITFKDASEEVLNVVKVPFTFTLPAITTLFQIDPGFIKNGVANCYMYADDAKAAKLTTTGADVILPTFKLSRIFKKYAKTGFTIALDAKTKVGETNKTSAELAYLGTGGLVNVAVANDTLVHITLGTEAQTNDIDKISAGYGQALNLTIAGKFADAWTYPEDEVFTFKASILSPIKEGKIVPKAGTTVTIPASALNNYKFGNDVITGYTYNSEVSYKVLPDKDSSAKEDNTTLEWTRNDIAGVVATSGNPLYFTVASDGKPTAATTTKVDGKDVVTDGAFVLTGYNVDHTVDTDIQIVVTDIWGYTTTDADGNGISVPVKITVGN